MLNLLAERKNCSATATILHHALCRRPTCVACMKPDAAWTSPTVVTLLVAARSLHDLTLEHQLLLCYLEFRSIHQTLRAKQSNSIVLSSWADNLTHSQTLQLDAYYRFPSLHCPRIVVLFAKQTRPQTLTSTEPTCKDTRDDAREVARAL